MEGGGGVVWFPPQWAGLYTLLPGPHIPGIRIIIQPSNNNPRSHTKNQHGGTHLGCIPSNVMLLNGGNSHQVSVKAHTH